jgi:hypothetical protein
MRRRALVLCVLLGSACAEDPCVERLEAVEGCGLHYRNGDMCDTSHGACVVACHASAGCVVLQDLLEGRDTPDSLSRCTAKCVEPFQCDDGATTIDSRWRCDGEADCRDSADEVSCTHHECANGQRVREDARCDDYPDCEDGSDEDGC